MRTLPPLYPEIRDFSAVVGHTEARHGTMLYLKNDAFIGRGLELYGELSEGETVLFKQIIHQNAVVIEAGANIGLHTLPMARAAGPCGRVIAFEPQRIIFQILCANLAMNGIANVIMRNEAVGYIQKPEDQWINVPPIDYTSRNNFGGIELGGDLGERVCVTPIDSLNLARLDFLKADVEGMEMMCLKGAQETIRRCQPTLYVENNRTHLSPALNKFMIELGYNLWWHIPPLYEAKNFKNNSHNIFPKMISTNVLALPKSRGVRVQGNRFRSVENPEEDWRSRFV
ncbi:MAG: FkbM family methyltransferase [Alphaproteobacteria bacterium]